MPALVSVLILTATCAEAAPDNTATPEGRQHIHDDGLTLLQSHHTSEKVGPREATPPNSFQALVDHANQNQATAVALGTAEPVKDLGAGVSFMQTAEQRGSRHRPAAAEQSAPLPASNGEQEKQQGPAAEEPAQMAANNGNADVGVASKIVLPVTPREMEPPSQATFAGLRHKSITSLLQRSVIVLVWLLVAYRAAAWVLLAYQRPETKVEEKSPPKVPIDGLLERVQLPPVPPREQRWHMVTAVRPPQGWKPNSWHLRL